MDDSKALAAETELCGSPPIKDDWEKVDLQGAEEGPALLSMDRGNPPPPQAGESLAPDDSVEEFKDAEEIKPQQGTEASVGGGVEETAIEGSGQVAAAAAAVESSGPRPVPSTEQPDTADGGKATVIAAGLANVRLPMGFDREGRLGGGGPADSDGEEEFHDAHDSGPGAVKDANKAREMKEIGNE